MIHAIPNPKNSKIIPASAYFIPEKMRNPPETKERITNATMSHFISFFEIFPDCTVRSGPTRMELSVPWCESPKSLAKFESICRKMVVEMARPNTVGLNCPSAYAKKLPKIALDKASGKVLNLKACIQNLNLFIVEN